MNIIKYTIEPTSPWTTPLRSDTLHGLIVCQVREWEGESACKDLITSFLEQAPPFICSSAFPKGFLPAPTLAPISRASFKEMFANSSKRPVEWLEDYKEFKKKAYIPCSVWNEHKNNVSSKELFLSFLEDKMQSQKDHKKSLWEVPSQYYGTELHLTLNREANKHLDGSFFGTTVNFSNNELEIYVQAKDHSFFENYFTKIGEYGFGADSSVGKGRFVIKEKQDVTQDFSEQGTHGLNLSVLSAESLKGIDGFYKCVTKKGKTWIGKNTTTPFKKPFIAIEEGAIIKNYPSNGILRNIHCDTEIIQICNALYMPCTLGE